MVYPHQLRDVLLHPNTSALPDLDGQKPHHVRKTQVRQPSTPQPVPPRATASGECPFGLRCRVPQPGPLFHALSTPWLHYSHRVLRPFRRQVISLDGLTFVRYLVRDLSFPSQPGRGYLRRSNAALLCLPQGWVHEPSTRGPSRTITLCPSLAGASWTTSGAK